MEGVVPKQYRRLGALPVLRHGLDRLLRHPGIDMVQVVIHTLDRELYAEAVHGLVLPPPVLGGTERQDTVRLGLEALAGDGPRHVLIHDGARPFVGAVTIDRVLAGLEQAPAVIPAVQITDTIKRVGDGGTVVATVDRAGLWGVQTPQGFHFEAILAAHRAAHGGDPGRPVATDDAQLAEAAGLRVLMVPGEIDNLKITRELDLTHAERLLQPVPAETRVGMGLAVEAFGPGDHVMLCGVAVPHEQGLRRPTADVALNALVDALAGALGGEHAAALLRPAGDRPGEQRVRETMASVRDEGGRLVNVDLTVIGERPKITPVRHALQARLADLLGLVADRVGIKATTTEGLGFAGRREGLAAQAAVAVAFPPP